MAKYCGNCGAQMDDSVRICGNCGTPFESSTTLPRMTYVDPEKKKKTRRKIMKTFKICAWLFCLMLVAVITFQIVFAFTGSNGLLRKVMAAYEDYDISTLVFLSSDMYFYGKEDSIEAEDYYSNYVGYSLDAFESAVGHSYKISYEVNEIYTVSERKLAGMIEEIKYNYPDFDTDVITKIVIADLMVTAKRGDKSIAQNISVVMSKENRSWRLLYIE